MSNGVYTDPYEDLKRFGQASIDLIAEAFAKRNVSKDVMAGIADQLMRHARLPYTNNWRVTILPEKFPCKHFEDVLPVEPILM